MHIQILRWIESASYLILSYLDGLRYVLVLLSCDRVVSEGSPAPPSSLPRLPPPPSQCDAPPTVAPHQLSLSSAVWALASLCVPKNTKSLPRSIVQEQQTPPILSLFLSFFFFLSAFFSSAPICSFLASFFVSSFYPYFITFLSFLPFPFKLPALPALLSNFLVSCKPLVPPSAFLMFVCCQLVCPRGSISVWL